MNKLRLPLKIVFGYDSCMDSNRLAPADRALMISGLSGVAYGINFVNGARTLLSAAIIHLNTCEPHAGVHHFAVTDEGATLWCSPAALACLNSANLGFTAFFSADQPSAELVKV